MRLSYLFDTIDALIQSCDIDYEALSHLEIGRSLFENYEQQRIVNSFLFNDMKIQDKIGVKLLRTILFELKELDDETLPMIDILNRLEKLQLIESAGQWDTLREIRNAIAHEDPLDMEERLENITMAIEGYRIMKQMHMRLKSRMLAS